MNEQGWQTALQETVRPSHANGEPLTDDEWRWIRTATLRTQIANKTQSPSEDALRRLVGPGCTIPSLRDRIEAAARIKGLTSNDVVELALAEAWMRSPLIILPTPRNLHLKNVAPRSGVSLSKAEQSDLARHRERAESFLNEPLTVHIRRLIDNGLRPEEVAVEVERRSEYWAKLTVRQVIWLTQQPDPEAWVRPEKPRLPKTSTIEPDSRSFWTSIRNEVRVHGVGGGLPTLGKRR